MKLQLKILTLAMAVLTSAATASEPQRVYKASPLPPATVTKEVPVYVPVPVKGQLMQVESGQGKKAPTKKAGSDSEESQSKLLSKGMESATMRPDADRFFNSITMYDWMDGALYTVYSAVYNTTDIRLQPGEVIQGQPAAGDTVRWAVGRGASGSGPERTEHVIVRPMFPGLETNMTIYTDRRTYYLRLHSFEKNYMASVAWSYPQPLPQLNGETVSHAKKQTVEEELDSLGYLDPTTLNFAYTIKNTEGKPKWKPERIFDNGVRTFIHFPTETASDELPILFIQNKQKQNAMVNYRKIGRYYVIDRLFDIAELRIGDKDNSDVVQIIRN
jgi:type IV secretion system protein VirB9